MSLGTIFLGTTYFLRLLNHCRWWLQPWNKKTLAPCKESYDQPRQHDKKQRYYFADKGPYSQGSGFSSSHVWMWELDHKEGWPWRIGAFKLWCWRRLLRISWTARRSNQLILKEISPLERQIWYDITHVESKIWYKQTYFQNRLNRHRKQTYVFQRKSVLNIHSWRTDAEAEAPILWPHDAKNWLIGKDRDAGKDWRQEEKGETENVMVGWHHRLKGHWVWASSGR